MFFERKVAIFYEKPGCAGNKKQKELLWAHGITLVVKSIMDTPWTKEQLKSFFNELENEDIVNPFAPCLKKRELDITKLTQDELIDKMIENPILIKRPLLEVDEEKVCGFNQERLAKLLRIKLETKSTIEVCQSTVSCP